MDSFTSFRLQLRSELLRAARARAAQSAEAPTDGPVDRPTPTTDAAQQPARPVER